MRNRLLQESIIELRNAAISTYNTVGWGYRLLNSSDLMVLKQPRVELAVAILHRIAQKHPIQSKVQ